MQSPDEIIAECLRSRNLEKLEKTFIEINNLMEFVTERIQEIMERNKAVEKSLRVNQMQSMASLLKVEAAIRKIKGLDA